MIDSGSGPTHAGDALVELDFLVSAIADGARLALPPDYSGCAMTAIKALIRRSPRHLHIVGVPSCGFQVDWLIGAGCVDTVETAAMTLDEFGLPPRFAAALQNGEIRIKDATCPVIHAGLQAAEKGVPFLPLRGILGSDLVRHRPDWKIINNPMGEADDPILLVPAITPDVALFHARACDRRGNVWIGVRRELMLMAHAARTTLVTVERVEDTDFLADETMAAGTIPALYISAIAVVPGGAQPIGLFGAYPADNAALARYVEAAQTREGFDQWAQEAIFDRVPA